jgi:DNA-binding response OmpR family regulator
MSERDGGADRGRPAAEDAVSKVLIVEDEAEIQDLIGDVLSLEGFEVHALSRIPHGLDGIRRLAPDAIVLDLMLPGMGGVELFRLLGADRQLAGTPIVICSGADHLREIHAREFAEAGAEVVAKPFELEDLLDAVRRAVARGGGSQKA